MIKHYLIYFLLAIASTLGAQQVTVSASAPSVVEAGEQFQLSYSINAEPSGFKAPDLSAFAVLAGPNRASSSNISIVNGRMSQSVTITLSYILQAKKEGSYTISPAVVTVDSKNYNSNQVSIQVVGGKQQSQQTQQSQQSSSKSTSEQNNSEKVYLKIIINKSDLYQNEYLTATVKFYSQLNVNDLGSIQLPKFSGIYSQEIEIPQIQLNRENINGVPHITGIIKQYYLFPQRNGDLIIEPFELEAVVAQPAARKRTGNPFDDFFFDMEPSYQWVKVKAKSSPLKIHVKSLPSGAPASFSGAVGQFTMNATIDNNKIKSNDAVTLKTVISGTGNLRLIEPFAINFPPDFEAYDPKTNMNIKGVSGSKTFEYVNIARHSGKFVIPPVEFSYFDPSDRKYKTIRSSEFNIDVEKGSEEEEINTSLTNISNKDDVKFIGKDIQFIKDADLMPQAFHSLFVGSWHFGMLYLIAIFCFVLFVILARKKIIENSNIATVRNKRANKQARKRLKKAEVAMNQEKKEIFYDEVLKALWGYLGDKFNIPASDLSRNKVNEILELKNIDEPSKQTMNELLDACEMAQYAPSAASSDLKQVYKNTAELISKFENIF